MKKQTAALLGLLEREGYSLHAMLFRLTLRQDVAEDLMQELFLKLRLAPGFAAAQDRRARVARTVAPVDLTRGWAPVCRGWRRVLPRKRGSAAGVGAR